MPDARAPALRVAFYGDDFTGSVDALLQFTRAGWRGRLFVGRPDDGALHAAAAKADVIGIAGIARSLPVARLDTEVLPALTALRGLDPAIVQYKACSTADSSPTIGNLGRVIEFAREVFGDATTVPILFAQPDFGRYTAFGYHFATEGGTVYRLDRQPTMSNHPVTPMHESDLALHLSRQTDLPIGSVHLTEYSDAATLTRIIRERADAATVLDAVHDDHVALVGLAVAGLYDGSPVFAIGSGGLSTGLGTALSDVAPTARSGDGEGAVRVGVGAGVGVGVGVGVGPAGPVLAVSGSRSPQTARQVAHAVDHGWAAFDLQLDVARPAEVTGAAVLAELERGRSVVVSMGDVDVAGAAVGGDFDLVERIAVRLADLVRSALAAGASRRVIICGGDTSSRVVSLLGAESLRIAANPIANVVVCRVSAAAPWLDGAELLLKGGQVGPIDLFESIRALGSPAGSGGYGRSNDRAASANRGTPARSSA